MNICVVGTGYVGLVTGAVFADLGNDIVCVDKDRDKIEALRAARMPIYEPADLKEGDLSGANLRTANLGLDNLGGRTSLQGATLLGASLEGSVTTGAEYSLATEFPVGFDPPEHGMTRVD